MIDQITTTQDAIRRLPCRQLRVVVETSPDVWRYIAKIQPYGADGGFAVIPAYEGQKGFLSKIKLTDSFSHPVRPPQPRMFDSRTVSYRIKLSFHPDGATQISAADGSPGMATPVTSGPDGRGDFKGMGIMARPFSQPVFTGGVFGITAFGLHHYRRASVVKDTVRFSSLELGKRGLLGRAAVRLMGYLIKRSEDVEILDLGPPPRIRSRRWNGITGRRELMELRVCNLRNEHCYLAIDCTRVPVPKADRNPSGYILSSQRSLQDVGIIVSFPPPKNPSAYNTLDRAAEAPYHYALGSMNGGDLFQGMAG